MLNIGNKKLKEANIGTTPLDSIYLGSTLIWKQKYLQWYDPEFKRVILETYNNGKEFRTKDELNSLILSKIFGNSSMQPISFENNTKIKGLFGGQKEYSNINCSLLDIGESCEYIYGDSGNSINSEYTVICRAKVPPIMGLNDPELEIINPDITENEKLMYPFKNGIKHLYVPDESINLYKNDIKYTNSYTVSTEENPIVKYKKINVKENSGNVRCWDGVEVKERNIGWSRFKDIIKPLSEYVES